jgi:hypothetical protein
LGPWRLVERTAILNIGVTDIVAARRVLEGRGVVFRGDTQIIPCRHSRVITSTYNSAPGLGGRSVF